MDCMKVNCADKLVQFSSSYVYYLQLLMTFINKFKRLGVRYEKNIKIAIVF